MTTEERARFIASIFNAPEEFAETHDYLIIPSAGVAVSDTQIIFDIEFKGDLNPEEALVGQFIYTLQNGKVDVDFEKRSLPCLPLHTQFNMLMEYSPVFSRHVKERLGVALNVLQALTLEEML